MSSSCCAPDTIFTLLSASFAALADEAPRHHARLAAALRAHRVELRVDDEVLAITSDGAAISVRPAAAPEPTARISATTPAILAVLDARRTLAEAVLCGEVAAIAPPGELDALREALLCYVRGGVRTTAFPALLTRLRARAASIGRT